jgi:hypothetical protein
MGAVFHDNDLAETFLDRILWAQDRTPASGRKVRKSTVDDGTVIPKRMWTFAQS